VSEESKMAANRKRAESMRQAWSTGKGRLASKHRQVSKPCACGCGQMTSLSADYLIGHSHRGQKRSDQWKERMSEGVKRAYREGKMQHAVHQSPEFIKKRTAPLIGKHRSPETCNTLSVALKKAWESGKFSPETIRNNAARIRIFGLAGKGCTPEHLTRIRSLRDLDKLRPLWASNMKHRVDRWKADGELDAIRRKGGIAKGMEDHKAANFWSIRDPAGHRYEFGNLYEWSRQNAHLFEDDRPESKTPFWKRIAGGLSALLGKAGKNHSHRGWTAVSKLEMWNGGSDLLARQVSGDSSTLIL